MDEIDSASLLLRISPYLQQSWSKMDMGDGFDISQGSFHGAESFRTSRVAYIV